MHLDNNITKLLLQIALFPAACNCNINSSMSIFCNQRDGACSCMTNVVGQDCSSCAENHWGLGSDSGCVECLCNATGSETLQCDMDTGMCSCRLGVTGDYCDMCTEGHYGFSDQGCRYKFNVTCAVL